MTKVLVIGDAGVPSGFGIVIHNIFERIVRDHGMDVHVLASNYRGDHVDTNLKLYVPNIYDRLDLYGESRFLELVGSIMPDALFFLNDPSIVLSCLVNNKYDPNRVLWNGITVGEEAFRVPILAYLPVDGYDSPRAWDVLKERVTRIAMTKFGQQAMPEAPVVWHGVDTSVFKPMDKREAKSALGFDPDRFLILRVDKNSTRKNYPDTWRALRPVMRKHPDIDVHFHCLSFATDGYDLRAFAFNDEDIRDRLTFSPNLTGYSGWSEEHLATLFAAADIFVSTSWGEGFGLANLQAIACGTPVIASACSANTEVIGPGGILIRPSRRMAVPMGQDQCLPDVKAFSAAIERLYLNPRIRWALGEQGVAHAAQFSWDVAASKIAALIEREVGRAVQEQRGPAESDQG